MPRQEVNTMTLRREFVILAQREDCNISKLCEFFGISRKTGYKWLSRFKDFGGAGLLDRSRKPHSSPFKSPESAESAIVDLRKKHPAWGGRKIKSRLKRLGHRDIPPSRSINSCRTTGSPQNRFPQHKLITVSRWSTIDGYIWNDKKIIFPTPVHSGHCAPSRPA